MAWFEGTHTEKITIKAPLAKVRDYFSNPENIIEHTNDIEEATVDGTTIHFKLTLQNYTVAKFQGEYVCRYTLDGDVLTWETLSDGNTFQSGKAVFAADGHKTTVDYTESVKVDVKVPSMMAAGLKPLVGQVLATELKGYLDRMRKAIVAS